MTLTVGLCRCTFHPDRPKYEPGHMEHQHGGPCGVPGCECQKFEQASEADLVDATGATGATPNPTLTELDPFEEDIQREVAVWLEKVWPQDPEDAEPDVVWWHTPNGKKASKRTNAIFRGLGAKPGIPDLAFLWAGGRFGFIEMKKPGGTLSPEQRKRRHWCKRLEIPFEVAESLADVQDTLTAWGLL